MGRKVRILLLVFLGFSCALGLVRLGQNLWPTGPRCTRTVTNKLPGSFKFLCDVLHFNGDNICVMVAGPEGPNFSFFKLNLDNLSLEPVQMVRNDQMVRSWAEIDEQHLLLTVVEHDKFSIISLGTNSKLSIPVPVKIDLKDPYKFPLPFASDNRLFALFGNQLLIWSITDHGTKAQFQSKITVVKNPDFRGRIASVLGQSLKIVDFGDAEYSVDLKSQRVEIVKSGTLPIISNIRRVEDKLGRQWTYESNFDRQPTMEQLLGEKNSDGSFSRSVQEEPFRSELICRDNGKTIFRTFIAGNRNYSNLENPFLSELLMRLQLHRVTDSENWPFAPTGIKTLFFDKDETPLIWTNHEGIFKLVDKQWNRIFEPIDFGSNVLQSSGQAKVLANGRICLILGGVMFNSAQESKHPALALLDSKNGSYELVRITFEEPYVWKEPPQPHSLRMESSEKK